jgi:hypothetical protein
MRGSAALICTLAAAALAGCGDGGGGGLDTGKVKAALTQIDAECNERSEALDEVRGSPSANANLKTPVSPEFKSSVSLLIAELDDHADDEVDSGSGRNAAYKDFVKAVGTRVANPSLQVRSCGGGEARRLGRRMIRAATAKGAT